MGAVAGARRRAYLGIKYHEDGANRALIEAVCAALEGLGWESLVVARDLEAWGAVRFEPEALMQATFREIEQAALVVIEISEKGVGVGIEAGYAHARSIPVVTLASEGADIPTTLRGIARAVIMYDDVEDLPRMLAQQLAESLDRPG